MHSRHTSGKHSKNHSISKLSRVQSQTINLVDDHLHYYAQIHPYQDINGDK